MRVQLTVELSVVTSGRDNGETTEAVEEVVRWSCQQQLENKMQRN